MHSHTLSLDTIATTSASLAVIGKLPSTIDTDAIAFPFLLAILVDGMTFRTTIAIDISPYLYYATPPYKQISFDTPFICDGRSLMV